MSGYLETIVDKMMGSSAFKRDVMKGNDNVGSSTVVLHHNRGYPLEIWVISFPKSGRTWLRALIGRYLTHVHNLPQHMSIATEWLTAGLFHLGQCSAVVFDHSFSEEDTAYTGQTLKNMRPLEHCNVMFIVRDLRDVVVSWYWERVKRSNMYDMPLYKGTISEFIRDELMGCPKIIDFWNHWEPLCAKYNYPVLWYELLHENPEEVLRVTLQHLNIKSIKDISVKEAVRWSHFDNLRKLESLDTFRGVTDALTAVDVHDSESYKMRKGKIGGYNNYLSTEDIKYVESMMAKNVWQRTYLK